MDSAIVTVSVVIPVLDDEAAADRLLAGLAAGDERPDEVILVEAGPGSLAGLARRHGVRHLVSPPGRGRQLDLGARHATGSVLWFLHADAEPPPGGVALLRQQVAAGVRSGHFRFRFTGPRSGWKVLLEALVNLRVRRGIPYGDQGLFVRRDLYLAIGGFPDVPLFEEVPLVRALRQAGGFHALPESIGVSPRRWERDGWLRRSLANRALALGHACGVPPARLARVYRAFSSPPGAATATGHGERSC